MDRFKAFKYWNASNIENEKDDIRCKIIKYAILAPNTHNIQPWKIRLDSTDGFYLYIDENRLLRHTDPDLRHIYMSQGTFLETLKIAATNFKHKCNITLLPEGIPSIENPDQYPVAYVQFEKDNSLKTHGLFAYITKRCTSHAVFDGEKIPEKDIKSLAESNYLQNEGYDFKTFNSSAIMDKMTDILIRAMKIQTNTAGPHSETIKMIRFRKKDLYTQQDGFSFQDLGVTGFRLYLAEHFATPGMANSAFFKKNVMRSFGMMARSAKAFCVIYAPEDTRETQILSGQLFCSSYLKATQLGLALQPMDHVFQKYKELESIEQEMCKAVEYNNKVPMAIFRIGYSNKSYHTPRRSIEDIYIK